MDSVCRLSTDAGAAAGSFFGLCDLPRPAIPVKMAEFYKRSRSRSAFIVFDSCLSSVTSYLSAEVGSLFSLSLFVGAPGTLFLGIVIFRFIK